MKKLLITLGLLLVVLVGYTQVTNVAEYRVADATTAFGVNLPVGSKVYDIANDKYYVATAGVASTETLTTASASFSLLNDAGTDDQEISDFSLSGTTLQLTLEGDANGQQTVDLSGLQDGTGTDDQTLSIDSTGRVFTLSIEGGNSVNFEDTNTQLTETEVDNFVANNGYLTTEVDGSTTNEIQTLDVAQLNGTNLELSLSSDGEATHQIDLSSLQDGTGTDDQTAAEVTITDAGDIITATDVEGALQENRTAIDLNAGNISTNTSDISSNASDILTNASGISTNASDITTNAGNISTNATDIAALEAIAKTVTATIDISSTPSYTHSLTGLVETEGCVVAINGAVIEPNKYTLTAGQIEIKSSLTTLYEFDQIVITYKTTL